MSVSNSTLSRPVPHLPSGEEVNSKRLKEQNSDLGALSIFPFEVHVHIFQYVHNPRAREISTYFRDVMSEVYKRQLHTITIERPSLISKVYKDDPVLRVVGVPDEKQLLDRKKALPILQNLFEDVMEELFPLEESKPTVAEFKLNPRLDIHGLKELESCVQDFNLLKVGPKLGKRAQAFLTSAKIASLPPKLKAFEFRSWLKNLALPVQITKLDLSSLSLTQFPPEITWIKRIKELNLSQNKLKALPPQIGDLTDLENLDLADNKLKSIPSEIGKLVKLTTLSLVGNDLTDLPDEIQNLVDLTDLDLHGNGLSFICQKIKDLQNLNWLDVRKNRIWSLQEKERLRQSFACIQIDK